MKKYNFIIAILFTFSPIAIVTVFSQTNINIIEKSGDELKMFNARQDFFGGSYRSAVNKYKEVLKNRPLDGAVHFFLGECYYMMRDYNSAFEFLEKAKSLNPAAHEDLHLVLGKTYHVKCQLDKALSEFNEYKKLIGINIKKIKTSDVDMYIMQCNLAKKLMSTPVNAKVTSIGVQVNSEYDDKGPVLSSDEKFLYFTSRRPSTDKAKTDKEGDVGFFDDVYETLWDEETKSWTASELMRGPINTEGYDACNSISKDGQMMFVYRNNPTEARGGEIYMSQKSTSGKWKTPDILLKPINTSYYEDAACISPDGNTLYFVSERPGGLGDGDIWMSKKGPEKNWMEPVNIGAPVNSSYDENGLFLHPDGKTLFFCSNGPGSMGSYDIFKTTLQNNGKWSTPINLGYPINSVSMESKFVLSSNNKTAYISSVRDTGLGERDIYVVDMTNYPIMNELAASSNPPDKVEMKTQISIIKGNVTTVEGKPVSAEIKISDKETGVLIVSATSNNNGNYSFELATKKNYLIEINKNKFQKVSEEFSLPAGKENQPFILIKNFVLNKK
ncbi:MAG: tetratricopeptide repeat protein [Bacteroidota bacterium]